MTDEVNQFFQGGGAPSVKFQSVGDKVEGTILATQLTEQRDYKTKEVKHWPDGNPMMQVVVTLQTDLHDDDEDDGKRRLFVAGRRMRDAVRDALAEADAELLPGGTIEVVYTGDEPTPGGNPAKVYKASYVAPPAGYADGEEPF